MKSHVARMGESLLRGWGKKAEDRKASGSDYSRDEYQMQVELLRAQNRELEKALADAIEASEAALGAQQRREAELLQRLDESRSAFEVAWKGFGAETTLDDRLLSLDPGDDRARRWLLTP